MPVHPFGGHLSRHLGRASVEPPQFPSSTLADPRDQLAPEDAYLSYYDIRLTKEDITVLKNDWLTDNIISFWQEYLEREFLAEYQNSKIILLRPAMSFMLLQTSDPRTLKDALPDFTHATHIFLPVNDCTDPTTPSGGNHWSLLLVSIIDGVAFSYDSLSNANQQFAYAITRQLSSLLSLPLKFIPLQDTPQQDNGSDCGVYVCLILRHLLLKRLLMVGVNEKVSMSMGSRRIDAREGRREMLRIIEERRREGERRRSLSKSPAPSANSTHSHARKTKSPPRIDSRLSRDGTETSANRNGNGNGNGHEKSDSRTRSL